MDAINLPIYTLTLPLTLGLVQLAKSAGLSTRWAGLAAVVIGALAGLFANLAGAEPVSIANATLTGIVAGLSAAGVWSGTRAGVRTQ
ncbi:MAG: hypothetical protein M9890_13345 [Thermomicrobiales bacterium]|nr:hypothetical protein [Thermomicrobiales bacterium]